MTLMTVIPVSDCARSYFYSQYSSRETKACVQKLFTFYSDVQRV